MKINCKKGEKKMHNQEQTKDDFMEALMEIFAKINSYYKQISLKENVVKQDEMQVDAANNSLVDETNVKAEDEKEIHMKSDLNININVDPKLDDEKINRFQNVMKKVIEEDTNEQINSIAKTFHDNPVESMKLLQSIVSKKAIESSLELKKMTQDTQKMIEEIRSTVNVNNPNAMDQISALNYLHSNEKKKFNLASNIINELKPLEKENETVKEHNTAKIKDKEMDGPAR